MIRLEIIERYAQIHRIRPVHRIENRAFEGFGNKSIRFVNESEKGLLNSRGHALLLLAALGKPTRLSA